MKLSQYKFEFTTNGREIINITDKLIDYVAQAQTTTGLCNVFLHHTSASLIIGENADHLVLSDLESFMYRLVPDGDPLYKHVDEGPDDMPSHVRSVLTTNSISIPISESKLALGHWQGVFLWEHRIKPHLRKFTVTVYGI